MVISAYLISDADAGADAVAIDFRARQAQDDPMAGAGLTFSPQLGGLAQRRDHRIDAAVAIEIGEGRAAMRLHERQAGFGRDILENAAGVGEDAVALPGRRPARTCSTRSFTCELAVNRSFQPSLLKSNSPSPQPLCFTVSGAQRAIDRSRRRSCLCRHCETADRFRRRAR